MLRSVALLAFVLLCVPLAAAEPLVLVTWEPGSIHTGDAEHYYFQARAGPPEPPATGEAGQHDCAYDARPSDAADSALLLAEKLGQIHPESAPSAWFPECVATGDTSTPLGDAYASYNISSGRYYVELETTWLPGAAGGPAAPHAASMSFTGTTGAEASADCETCPPPYP